jgi:hypothetical protein
MSTKVIEGAEAQDFITRLLEDPTQMTAIKESLIQNFAVWAKENDKEEEVWQLIEKLHVVSIEFLKKNLPDPRVALIAMEFITCSFAVEVLKQNIAGVKSIQGEENVLRQQEVN